MKKAIPVSAFLGLTALLGFWWMRSRAPVPSPAPERASFDSSSPANPPAETKTTAATPVADPKIAVLKEILAAKNDGDARLDTEFKSLSPETKERMRALYRTLAPEKLNEKGTIVFLLGRNLQNEVDFDFVDEVLAEPPCRSLSDCGRAPAATTGEEAHMESGAEVTLAYPQLVAVKALERMLEDDGTPAGLNTELQKRLENAKRSTTPVVARQAEQALVKTSGT